MVGYPTDCDDIGDPLPALNNSSSELHLKTTKHFDGIRSLHY